MKYWVVTLLVVLVCGGCAKSDRKAVYPVTGKILVDGQPVDKLVIKCIPVEGMDPEKPTTSGTFTDAEGKFALSTYDQGDGVPAGEYLLAVRWGEFNAISMSHAGDKFKGKYDEKNSTIKVIVKEGEPTDLGTIELSTK